VWLRGLICRAGPRTGSVLLASSDEAVPLRTLECLARKLREELARAVYGKGGRGLGSVREPAFDTDLRCRLCSAIAPGRFGYPRFWMRA